MPASLKLNIVAAADYSGGTVHLLYACAGIRQTARHSDGWPSSKPGRNGKGQKTAIWIRLSVAHGVLLAVKSKKGHPGRAGRAFGCG